MMEMAAYVSNPPLPKQYGDELLVFTHGKGCRLFDRAGKSYLDMGAGIAVNALGYGRDDLAQIAADQMRRLVHVSNLFATEPQLELAGKMLSVRIPGNAHAHFEAIHFGNSGSEANETALKYARLYSKDRKGEGHHRLIAFTNSFHGRTMGALSLTANPAYREPFGPLIPGCEILPFNDVSALEAALDDTVSAVIIEPVQGEGGLNPVSREFAKALNRLCRQYDIMLIADEVQTGLGRCGSFFATGLVGLEPDMITLAKPLAGGTPFVSRIGACRGKYTIETRPTRHHFRWRTGNHSSRFGCLGHPLGTGISGRYTAKGRIAGISAGRGTEQTW